MTVRKSNAKEKKKKLTCASSTPRLEDVSLGAPLVEESGEGKWEHHKAPGFRPCGFYLSWSHAQCNKYQLLRFPQTWTVLCSLTTLHERRSGGGASESQHDKNGCCLPLRLATSVQSWESDIHCHSLSRFPSFLIPPLRASSATNIIVNRTMTTLRCITHCTPKKKKERQAHMEYKNGHKKCI